jgi:phosphate ABC transporter permease protein PstC
MIPIHDFLFGLHWSPQSAFAGAGEVVDANPEVFGAIPLIVGTLFITFIAMMVAAPIGLFAAIYLSDYASKPVRAIAKPVLEILAGVPTVVYGFFAALTVAPFIRQTGEGIGLDVSSESALAAGVVMGIMIIPFVSSLSDDVISAVPQSLRDGSLALGSTKSETVRRVVLPAALPGIVSAMILAISRAIGETMIVVMAAGLAANLTINPLEAVTTVTVQIVTCWSVTRSSTAPRRWRPSRSASCSSASPSPSTSSPCGSCKSTGNSMTDIASPPVGSTVDTGLHTSDAARRRLKARYAAEFRFKLYGILAVATAGLFLVVLLSTIVGQAIPAFVSHQVTIPVDLSRRRCWTRTIRVRRPCGAPTTMPWYPQRHPQPLSLAESRDDQRTVSSLGVHRLCGAPARGRACRSAGHVRADQLHRPS